MPHSGHPDSSRSHPASWRSHHGRSAWLTPREQDVAALLGRGLSNQQIAERLVLTPGTVANHVGSILSKLGARSRLEVAVGIARDQGGNSAETILGLLELLRGVASATAREALAQAATVLATVFGADKVDAFFHDAGADLLIALGTSRTPLGQRQHELGLDRLPLANGGRAAWVFQHKRPFRDGHVERDAQELVGVRAELGVRSTLAVPIEVGADQQGVLQASSTRPEHFSDDQVHLLQFVAYWIGLVARDRLATDRPDMPGNN
jgi:DNA-binding CsgD family transcriptional regulator